VEVRKLGTMVCISSAVMHKGEEYLVACDEISPTLLHTSFKRHSGITTME
jgi:hypothetical protein